MMRDMIEETVNLEGVPIRLLDTAGLRASESDRQARGNRAHTKIAATS